MKKGISLVFCILAAILLCSCGTDPNMYNGNSGHIDKVATNTITITRDDAVIKYYSVTINGVTINIQLGVTAIIVNNGIVSISIYNIKYYDDSISFDWNKENK